MDGSGSAEERYRAACGEVIGRLRARQGWSLREFGEQVGAAHTTLYAIERGEAVPGIEILDRIASACDLDLPSILRLIIDQLTVGAATSDSSLTDLLAAAGPLTPVQRRDLLTFIDYLRHRDRDLSA